MPRTNKLSRLFVCGTLLALIFSITSGLSPVHANANSSVSDGALLQQAAPRININDVLLNVRASTSVRTKEMVRVVDNPAGFNYEGTFIFGIPAIKILEKIGFGDDTEGMDTGYSTYIGTPDSIWYGIEDNVSVLSKSTDKDSLETVNRIFNLAGAFPFDAIPPGNFAKLNKADQTVDKVACDEYAWNKGKDEYTMCIIRDTALPVVLHAKVSNLLIDVHFLNYDDPENIFRLPRDSAKAFYVSDAFMSLLSLKNFEYKVVYGSKNAKAVQIDSTVQGLFVQDARSWQASEWPKTDDTSGPAVQRYLQIGRSRWMAPGDTTKPFKTAPVLNPRAVIQFSDKFTRAMPFLLWMSMVSDKRFTGAAKIVDDKATFNGNDAVTYKVAQDEKKLDDFVEITVLKESGVPVHVDYHFTEGARKNVITWDMVSMDETGKSIEAPPTPAKK